MKKQEAIKLINESLIDQDTKFKREINALFKTKDVVDLLQTAYDNSDDNAKMSLMDATEKEFLDKFAKDTGSGDDKDDKSDSNNDDDFDFETDGSDIDEGSEDEGSDGFTPIDNNTNTNTDADPFATTDTNTQSNDANPFADDTTTQQQSSNPFESFAPKHKKTHHLNEARKLRRLHY